jgi:putative transposase
VGLDLTPEDSTGWNDSSSSRNEESTMRKSRHTEEQIIKVLNQAEAGRKIKDLCRAEGISQETFDRRRRTCGGLDVSEAKRLEELEYENRRLNQPLRICARVFFIVGSPQKNLRWAIADER